MKILQSVILTIVLFLTFTPVLQASSEQVILDFATKNFNYGYEEWEQTASVLSQSESGVKINGTSRGGVGAYFLQLVDISESKQLTVELQRGPENTAEKLLLKMITAGGETAFETEISLKEVSDSEPTTLRFDLPAPGTPAAEKLEDIKQLQLQGNFAPGQKVDVQIVQIAATSTPAPAAK